MKKTLIKVKKHYQKSHEKMKKFDHKVLEFIHGMELSVVLILSFVAISSAFIFFVTPSDSELVSRESKRIERTLIQQKIEEIASDEVMSKAMEKILETEEGKQAFIQNLMTAIEDEKRSRGNALQIEDEKKKTRQEAVEIEDEKKKTRQEALQIEDEKKLKR